MKTLLSIAASAIMLIWATGGYSQNASDYLVCQDLGNFKKYGCTCGTGAGTLMPVDHFGGDHNDISCTVIYHSMEQRMGIDVEVTKHAGADSDKWLLHELESSFRGRTKTGQLGARLYESASIREINGNNIIDYGNVDYRWISNYVVIYIHYVDLEGAKPEPLEIVNAYLAKFPSTISLTDNDLKSQTHSIQWIKDEMDRRLWLCDKWFSQLQLQKVQQGEALQAAVKSMNIFLDYREKYFGVKAANEKNLLASYLNINNGTKIKAKLDEYKSWWATNKASAISL
jgi:hypothetical protein